MSVDDMMVKSSSPNIADTNTYQSVNKENIYCFMDNAFDGTGGFRSGTYLVPHSREMFYEKRKDLAFYKNFVRPIIDAMVVPVFNRPVSRKSNNDLFNEFLDNCDGLGTSLQSFAEDTLTLVRLHGVAFVVVENYPASEQPADLNTAVEQRVYPYVYTMKASQFVSAQLSRTGAILSITFVHDKIKITTDGKEKEVDAYIRFSQMTTEILYKEKDEMKVYETYEHNLGEVPVFPIYSTKRKNRKNLLIEPPLFDLAKINHAIFNKDSEIREIERSQGFSIFYVQTDSGGNLTVGTNNVILLPKDTNIAPGFASPDSSIQTNLVNYQKELRDDLFRIAEQHGVTGVQAKSGVAIQWDFYAHESVLKKTSSLALSTEQYIAYLFGLYIQQEITYEVTYPTTFQPNDKTEAVKVADTYLQFDLPPSAKSMALVEITKLLFSNKSTEELAPVIEDIENMASDETNAVKEVEGAAGEITEEGKQQIVQEFDEEGNPIMPDKIGGISSVATTLNGAQITAAIEVVNGVTAKTLPEVAGIELLIAVGIPEDRAKVIANAAANQKLVVSE
jgi:hypothetical protein